MIEDIINVIKKSRERRRKNLEENRRRYWNFEASERLHYDSRINKIREDYSSPLLGITFSMVSILFYIFVFFLLLKLLFELDVSVFILILPPIISLFPLIFATTVTLDLIIVVINALIIKPNHIKRLNERYGFKEI